MMRILVSLCLALCSLTASFAQAPVTIDLGPRNDVAALYSFPNNCAEVCFVDRSLSETIKWYVHASLDRDGFGATTVNVSESAGRVYVQLVGAGAASYGSVLPAFLAAGERGFKDARELLTAVGPDGHKVWRYNWRFFLPHGIAVVQHRSVQLLHFPPDNVLLDTQDYLAAQTTLRWARLLVLNGADKNEVDRFQNIIDIAPIALPDKDACYLDPPCQNHQPSPQRSGVYPHFDDYIDALLNLWLPRSGDAGSRPLVAFGGPVRKWLKDVHKIDLAPAQLGMVTLASGMRVPTLGANHPSYIWHAKDDVALATRIMRDDLKAACWEVKMGMDATASPEASLTSCEQTWTGQDLQICELTETQDFDKTLAQAQQLCTNADLKRSISDAELDAFRKTADGF
jgi:hypothetical protein